MTKMRGQWVGYWNLKWSSSSRFRYPKLTYLLSAMGRQHLPLPVSLLVVLSQERLAYDHLLSAMRGVFRTPGIDDSTECNFGRPGDLDHTRYGDLDEW